VTLDPECAELVSDEAVEETTPKAFRGLEIFAPATVIDRDSGVG